VVLHEEGKVALTASADNTLRAWSTVSAAQSAIFTVCDCSNLQHTFASIQFMLCSSKFSNYTIQQFLLYVLLSFSLCDVPLQAEGSVTGVSMHPTGSYVVCCDDARKCTFADVATLTPIASLSDPEAG
jgi:WD40 repeat protein